MLATRDELEVRERALLGRVYAARVAMHLPIFEDGEVPLEDEIGGLAPGQNYHILEAGIRRAKVYDAVQAYKRKRRKAEWAEVFIAVPNDYGSWPSLVGAMRQEKLKRRKGK